MAKLTRKEFIILLAPYAVADMEKSKVPASLTIAQGILESADGNSTLTLQANNLFGIKGKGTAGSVRLPTQEFRNNEWITIQADFRKYNNWGESVADHSALFQNGVSWNPKLYHGVIGKDGITAAKEVAKAGYATDPQYADKLIKLINDNDLLKYDKPKKTESERIAELEENVIILIKGLTQVSDTLAQIDPPPWFLEEFPNVVDKLSQKTGTLEFWRGVAVTLRIIKN